MVGIGKPIGLRVPDWPIAAHEKIASDLAYHLGLPVPPVILWDRGPQTDGTCSKSCVSLVVFENQIEGPQAIQAARASRQILTPALGAILPFYRWITATDRWPRHTIYGVAGGAESLLFIDFDRSFDPRFDEDFHEHDANLDEPGLDAQAEISQKISEFPDNQIVEIVSRIPDSFLPEAKKTIIIRRLKAGRGNVTNPRQKSQ